MNYKKGTQTRGCMKSVMRYVSQLSKTLWDGQQLVSGIGCQPETAFDEFLSTKLLHHKDGGVMFYHMVQSFPRGADVDPRTAHEAARRLAGYFEGCEVLVCTHVDREHIHSHCIINSVNFETGRKVHMADEQIQELRVRNDEICEELGLPKFQRDEQRKAQGMSNAEYYTASKGESWKFELMRVIDECMRYAGNRDEFLTLLRAEGYDAAWRDSRKNITYTTPDGRKCRDNKLHIEKYLKENMEAEFEYRTEEITGRTSKTASAVDERSEAVRTQCDGHREKLERDARNAGQAVSAADAAGRGLENAPDAGGRTDRIERDAGEYRKIRETGWEPEREVFFQLQGADREYEALPDRDPERYEETAFGYSTGSAEENSPVRMDLNRGIDLVRGAVRLGRAVEQMTDTVLTRDASTTPMHIDSKRRRKLRQKKTALGHAEDDHEDWDMKQEL
ncbi:MAG TPA: relaxase/mobilization nuclease domain-containing protein [Clostridiales bacterium]|nr:relaxase/mobilization nuclease domain-containing protein [Clostridiales bacterium]